MPNPTVRCPNIDPGSRESVRRALDGPIAGEAQRLLLEGGALTLFDDDGVNASVYHLEGGEDGRSIADDLLDFLQVHGHDDDELGELVTEALADRLTTAYLLGLAVGRQIGGAR